MLVPYQVCHWENNPENCTQSESSYGFFKVFFFFSFLVPIRDFFLYSLSRDFFMGLAFTVRPTIRLLKTILGLKMLPLVCSLFFPVCLAQTYTAFFFFLNPLQRTEFPFGPGAGLAVLQFRFPENLLSPFILCSEQHSDFFFFKGNDSQGAAASSWSAPVCACTPPAGQAYMASALGASCAGSLRARACRVCCHFRRIYFLFPLRFLTFSSTPLFEKEQSPYQRQTSI